MGLRGIAPLRTIYIYIYIFIGYEVSTISSYKIKCFAFICRLVPGRVVKGGLIWGGCENL